MAQMEREFKEIISETPGADLVTNGDFATDSDWTKGTGWSIGAGVASCDGTQASWTRIYQVQVITALPILYKVTFDITSYTAGMCYAWMGNGGPAGDMRTAIGSYVDYLWSDESQNGQLGIRGNVDFIGSIDNVTCKAVLDNFSDPIKASNDASVSLELSGTFVATVTVQYRFKKQSGQYSDWIDLETQTAPGRWNWDADGDEWRFGVKPGEYTSGTISGIIQAKRRGYA